MDAKPFVRPALNEIRLEGVRGFIAHNTRTSVEELESAQDLVDTLGLALERRIKEIITAKGLIDTGALRASVAVVERRGSLKARADVAARQDVDLDPEDFADA